MRELRKFAARLVREEDGGAVLEYALVAGLISVVAIAVVATVGTKVFARWNKVDGSL